MYDLYEAYPYGYPTVEQTRKHSEAMARSQVARKVCYEPYPYSYPTAEMIKKHNTAMKKLNDQRAAKKAKERDILHHAWE